MATLKFDVSNFNSGDMETFLFENSLSKIAFRDHFGLFEEYVSWVREGRKCTTVRYRKGMIDFPKNFILRIISTNPITRVEGQFVGWAHIQQITIKTFGELTVGDAINDGFQSIDELKQALFNIYGKINNGELVTIYKFKFLEIGTKKKKVKHCHVRNEAYIH